MGKHRSSSCDNGLSRLNTTNLVFFLTTLPFSSSLFLNTRFALTAFLYLGSSTCFHTSFFQNWLSFSCMALTQFSSSMASSMCLGSISDISAVCPRSLRHVLVWTLSVGTPMIWLYGWFFCHVVSRWFSYFFLRIVQ